MVSELHTKSQVTIPKEIVSSMGLSVGDKFEIIEKDGIICLIPVVVYPKKYIEELQEEAKQIKSELNGGSAPIFDTVEEMMGYLEKK